ncbi:MAG: flagellar protein FlaG [Desulfobacteraceae bacterium]|nr:flagellar protein FlaG [Desulfobacteraceae bacterium]
MDNVATKVNGQSSIDVSQLQSIEANLQQTTEAEPTEEKIVQTPSGMTSQDVMDVLDSFQNMSKTIQTKLNFTVHEENNEIIVKVIDKESNQLIRQFPSDEMLNLQDKMRDMAGFLFNANA